MLKNKETGEEYLASRLLTKEELENPDNTGKYNYEKYLSNFNVKVSTLLVGFDPDVQKKLLVKINKKGELVKGMFTQEQLELKNFDFDSVDESMHLGANEVLYWNSYGYDPRKIWDGFKTFEEHPIYYDVYEHALKYLNDKLKEKNSNKVVKAVDDEYVEGDMILIKNKEIFDIGLFNGTYVEIIRENVQIPKSEEELERERIHNEKIAKLKSQYAMDDMTNESFVEAMGKRRKYFLEFKKKFKVKEIKDLEFDEFMENIELVGMLDQFAKNEEEKDEDEDYGDIGYDD